MNYKAVLSDRAIKELKKLDKSTTAFILAWISKNIDGIENPRQKGKGLTANRGGQWRYRIGNYRIIAHISDITATVLILAIAHRRDVYDD